MALIAQAYRDGTHIYTGYSGALHRDSDTDAAHLAVSHILKRILFIPIHHGPGFFHALADMAALQPFIVISRHNLSFPEEILPSDFQRIDTQKRSRLI